MKCLSLVLCFLAASSQVLAQPHWKVDRARSKLGFTVQWSGEPFVAAFKSWNADISFDPADLARSKATVVIDINSEASDFPDNDEGLKGTQGFEAVRFPSARFETTRITRAQGNSYVAEGMLTLHGMTRHIALPFILTIKGNTAHMTGKTIVMRTDFGLAGSEFSGETPIALAVTVMVDLTAIKP